MITTSLTEDQLAELVAAAVGRALEANRPAEYLSTRTAARIAGRSQELVRRWIRHGQLQAVRRGGRWVVERSVLERFLGARTMP